MKRLPLLLALLTLLISTHAFAQYNRVAGQSAPRAQVSETYLDDDGVRRERVVEREPQRDQYGNANGTQFDLAVDGAFEGQTVTVIQLYQFPFEDARAALKQKGFGVYRFNGAPSVDELKKALKKSCQLWVISDMNQHLTDEHIKVIKGFFDEGHGVYIWGDNQPYYADANRIGIALLDASMLGDTMGDTVVGMKEKTSDKAGIVPNLLLSTGIEQIYEGITIATIQPNDALQPLIYGSAGNLVTAFYDHGGKRAIFDGGFTRLYNKWDTAGTGRYVKNAAAWLANAERFGEIVATKKKD
ncbi:MAG: hypothetical protein R3E66_00990 [bacterium]